MQHRLCTQASGHILNLVVKTKEDAELWLEKSSVLTRKHLRDEISEAKTGVEQSTCPHDETYTVKICKKCNVRIKVYEQ